MPRTACLAIGVSRAEKLDRLHGAVQAAIDVGEWAVRSGFAEPENVRVLTDLKKDEPVTIARIRAAVEELLPRGDPVETFVLHFAGHGLREDTTKAQWLPTDWSTERRVIGVEPFKNLLAERGIAHLSIIADACKARPDGGMPLNYTADGVLGAGWVEGKRPELDRFDAVPDGRAAFMVPGKTLEESRCLFSGAVIEALWAHSDRAFDKHNPDWVTSGSMVTYLRLRLEELCRMYELDCTPDLIPGHPPEHVVFFDRTRTLASGKPSLRAWPEPVRHGTAQLPDAIGGSGFGPGPSFLPGSDGRPGGFDQGFGSAQGGEGYEFQPIDPRGMPRYQQNDWVEALSDVQAAWLDDRDRLGTERRQRARVLARRRTLDRFDFATEKLPSAHESDVVVRGGRAKTVWSQRGMRATGASTGLVGPNIGKAVQIVVEFDDGVFVPALVYSGLVTIVSRDPGGDCSWLCVSPHPVEAEHNQTALGIVDDLRDGQLAPAELDRAVAAIRLHKHANPVIGAISAYLYDYAGDLDSIRRMAAFYAKHHQPIPFDIALMAELTASMTPDGLVATVEPVAPRADHNTSALPDFVTGATPMCKDVPVAGRCPWLRQGWDFVEKPTSTERALALTVPPLAEYLRRETFTAFEGQGGPLFVEMLGLEPWS